MRIVAKPVTDIFTNTGVTRRTKYVTKIVRIYPLKNDTSKTKNPRNELQHVSIANIMIQMCHTAFIP